MTKTRWNNLMRILALVAAFSLLFSLAAPGIAAEGDDTVTIQSADDLLELAEKCRLDTWSEGKTVVLEADISLEDVDFSPIPTFGGTFDGGGHTITGLSITGSVSPAGLFGVVSEGAVIQNLNVSGTVSPTGSADTAGGIAGENNGRITGCSFTGAVSGSRCTGGIAGINTLTGTIENCGTGGTVFGENMTGGITGYNLGIVRSCQNDGYVNITSVDPSIKLSDIHLDLVLDLSKLQSIDTSASAMDTGGIAGYSSGILESCVNNAAIGYQHIGYNVGGIVGRSCGYIVGCTNHAEIYGRKDVGGIAGQMEPYIEMTMTEDTLSKLQQQLEDLRTMVQGAADDAGDGIGAASSRLNKITNYLDSAANAANSIEASGTIRHTATGSGDSGISAGTEVSLPQVDIEGGISIDSDSGLEITPPSVEVDGGTVIEGGIEGGLTPTEVESKVEQAANGAVDALTQISVNTSLGQLSAAVKGMSGQIRLLNGELTGTAGALQEDMKAIGDQIDAITDTLFEAVENTREGSDTFTDTSELDVDAVTSGKAALCENYGEIQGDISVGGVVGTMAIEYVFDPEDDVTSDLGFTQRKQFEMKAIIQDCTNRASVTAKRSYAGSICGRMDLGLITRCYGLGSVESENGDYVGGIAGQTGGTIRSCFAKCILRGGSYIGGIAGTGVEEDVGGSSSVVAGCYALVSIPEYSQYIGAISGADIGTYTENYFVSETLAGINGRSFSGKAEPISYDALCAVEGVPEEMTCLTLRFVAENETIQESTFYYGGSFDAGIFPEIPRRDGYYAQWDTDTLENLCFDTTVTAVYTPYVSALSAQELRGDGRPIFFAEGQFEDGMAVETLAQAKEPSAFGVLSDSIGEAIKKYFSFVTDLRWPDSTVSREIVEQWQLTLPDDGLSEHTVRYLSPDGTTDNLDIYVRENGQWEKVSHDTFGSYLTFPVKGSRAEIAVISTLPVWWVWLLALALLIALIVGIIALIRKLRRKRQLTHLQGTGAAAPAADVPPEEPAAVPAFSEQDSALLQRALSAEQRLAKAEEELRLLRQQQAQPEQAPQPSAETSAQSADASVQQPDEKKDKKKKRRLIPLCIGLGLAAVAAIAAAALYILPKIRSGAGAYDLLESYASQETQSMRLIIDAELDGSRLKTEADIYCTEVDGHAVTCVETDGIPLYFADGVVYLENGKAYGTGELVQDYSALLDQSLSIYKTADITERDEKGSTVYQITAKQDQAKDLLEILLPSAAAYVSAAEDVKVDLVAEEGDLSAIRFAADGYLEDKDRTPFSVTAELELQNGNRMELPGAVREAILSGTADAGSEITEDLLQLISAWANLNKQDPLTGKINLSANCGPLVLSDQLQMQRTIVDGEQVTGIRKNDLSFYFTDDKICDGNGHELDLSAASLVEAARLYDVAYQTCLNGDATVTRNGDTCLYTLMLDEEGMEAVAYAIAPDAEDMDILFTTGSIQVVLEKDRIKSIHLSCDGSMKIVLSTASVSISGEFIFDSPESGAEEITFPEPVIESLSKI